MIEPPIVIRPLPDVGPSHDTWVGGIGAGAVAPAIFLLVVIVYLLAVR